MFVLVFAFVCYGFASLDDSIAEKLSESSGSDKELTVISSGSDVENVDEAEIVYGRSTMNIEVTETRESRLCAKYCCGGYAAWYDDILGFEKTQKVDGEILFMPQKHGFFLWNEEAIDYAKEIVELLQNFVSK